MKKLDVTNLVQWGGYYNLVNSSSLTYLKTKSQNNSLWFFSVLKKKGSELE